MGTKDRISAAVITSAIHPVMGHSSPNNKLGAGALRSPAACHGPIGDVDALAIYEGRKVGLEIW